MIELIFLAIGLLLGCAMKQYKLSGSTAIGIILVTYFLSIMAGMQKNLDFLKYFTTLQVFRRQRAFPLRPHGRDLPAHLGGDHCRLRGCRLLDLQQARSIYLVSSGASYFLDSAMTFIQ